MIKKRLILSSLLVSGALMANENILKVFSETNGVPIGVLKLENSIGDVKKEYTKHIIEVSNSGNLKGLVIETKEGFMTASEIFSKDGENIFKKEFMELNKEYIEALENQSNKDKELEKERAPKVAKFIKSIEDGQYGDIVRTIPGTGTKEAIYFFTDPLCPYCKMYESSKDLRTGNDLNYGIKFDLKEYKEVKVVMYPLYMIKGHETSIKRSFWFQEKSKGVKDSDKILELLNQSSNLDITQIKVNEKDYSEYEAMIKDSKSGILANELIQGTPSIYTKDGIDPRK